jgi:hypothetical protein
MKARIKEDDDQVLLFVQWLLLYNPFEGKTILFILERRTSAKEEIMFDCNELAKENTSI